MTAVYSLVVLWIKPFAFLKWRLKNWGERRLKSVSNVRLSHGCLEEKKMSAYVFGLWVSSAFAWF